LSNGANTQRELNVGVCPLVLQEIVSSSGKAFGARVKSRVGPISFQRGAIITKDNKYQLMQSVVYLFMDVPLSLQEADLIE